MKRAGDELERDTKRQKCEYRNLDSTAIFRDSTQEKNGSELVEWSPGEPGFISGTIAMKWPLSSGKYRVKIQMFSTALGKQQFDAVFSGCCAEEFQRRKFEFKMGYELFLSLDGAVRENASRSKINLPIVLKYSDGVALEMKAPGQGSGCKIDTWFRPAAEPPSEPPAEEPPQPTPAPGDWFATPKQNRLPVFAMAKSDLMDVDEQEPSHSPPEKPAFQRSIAPRKSAEQPKPDKPLSSRGNSLTTTIPIPASQSSSRLVRMVPSASADVVHPPRSSSPGENPQKRRDVVVDRSSAPPKAVRAPTTSDNHASTSKLPERLSAALEPPAVRSPSEPDTAIESEPILNKKQLKNKQRKEKRRLKAASVSAAPASAPSVLPNAKPPLVPAEARPPSVHIERISPASAVPIPAPKTQPPAPSSSSSPVAPNPPTSTAVKPRLAVPWPCIPLSEVKGGTQGWSTNSVIGVVTSNTSPTRTVKGHWTCCIRIVDPSNCDEAYIPTRYEGLMINCFTPSFPQWLPTVVAGNVVILHQLRVKAGSRFADVVANGYGDKLKWAVYDHEKGETRHGDLGDAPQSATLGVGGYGAHFSPFYDATVADSAYCLKLHVWWQGVCKKRREQMGTIHQIGSGTSLSHAPRRKHQLVSETQTGQYFDCTVRVIHGYQTGQTYRLYCTDGTPLNGARLYEISECPRSLVEYLFQIEMWDGAGEVGPGMRPGEYYRLRNVFMKGDHDGYVEAKMSEPKIRKLDPQGEDAADAELKALIHRLQPHDDADVDDAEDVPLKLIKQVKEREHFNCVVELLHKDESQRAIYVSDYSKHPKIPLINDAWAHGLDGYVLKIILFDEQFGKMKDLVVGQYYRIMALRLRMNDKHELGGTLAGHESLICPLNPRSSSLEVWKQELIERKNAIKSKNQMESLQETAPQPIQISSLKSRRDCVTIKQVLASTKCPATFFVRARVVDFFPLRLREAFIRTCTKCHSPIPLNRLACHACNDVEKQYVAVVSVLRLLVDDGEDRLKVSVSGNVPVLNGIQPTILLDDPQAARDFSKHMRPLLNNLEAVHEGIVTNELVEPSTETSITLTIDNWMGKDENLVYGLRDFEL
ncbi:hypothetical protein C8F04DRAFT_1062939 [Mycena alexandri]|uniref:Protection of telomeres protein 1 n=1 Tax=Mycena alexandri TaxID=1745969 RepID=A0AAD6XEM0_9AGAR|nr:hypothetical protein C8F04DRAFT_1062939 [Mycena alexandri]